MLMGVFVEAALPETARDLRCHRRAGAVLSSVMVAAFMLAGCMSEPGVRGGVSVGVDAIGNPVAIVTMCGVGTHKICLVSLGKDASGAALIGEWHSDDGAPDDATIPLKTPPPG